jgi:hypothetical protein
MSLSEVVETAAIFKDRTLTAGLVDAQFLGHRYYVISAWDSAQPDRNQTDSEEITETNKNSRIVFFIFVGLVAIY